MTDINTPPRALNLPIWHKPAFIYAVAFLGALIFSVIMPDPVLAQANVEGLADNILNILSSTLLRTLAIIALIVTGLLWFTGRASATTFITVLVGIIIVFSAPWIVDQIIGGE